MRISGTLGEQAFLSSFEQLVPKAAGDGAASPAGNVVRGLHRRLTPDVGPFPPYTVVVFTLILLAQHMKNSGAMMRTRASKCVNLQEEMGHPTRFELVTLPLEGNALFS
jgi:hypothetical protein